MGVWIKKAVLATTAFKKEQFPSLDPGEIAFAGKSNVGKSSLLNRIMGTKKLVKVSSRPGFTQSVNFFSITIGGEGQGNEAFFVDLPGYGFAKAPASVKKKWERLIGAYFSSGRKIKGVVAIFDIRRNPDALDLELISFLRFYNIPIIPVLNKCDKLGRGASMRRAGEIRTQLKGLGINASDLECLSLVSARSGSGVDDLRSLLLTRLVHT